MKNIPIRLNAFLFLILFTVLVKAQSNYQWKPVGADTTFPRTIIHSWEIPDVKLSLATGQNISIYQNIYNSALSTIPVGNATLVDRANRSAIAKNAAFVLMLGVKPNGNTTANLLPAEKTNLKTRAITLLEQLNTYIYPITSDSPVNFNAWHHFSKDLIMSIEAYDFLKAAGATDVELTNARNTVKNMVGDLYSSASTGGGGFNFFQTTKNNQSLIVASAIGIAAVVFNDLPDTLDKFRPINWINCGMWNVHNILWWDIRRVSDTKKNAGYAEGPYFFRYAFCAVLPFIKAMGNFAPDTTVFYDFNGINRKIRNPWYDTNYTKLYDWYAAIRLPDGRMPAIEDTYMNSYFPEIAIVRQQKYLTPMSFSGLDSLQDNTFNKQITSVYDMRADYVAANMVPQPTTDSAFIALPDAGAAVFKSSSDSSATYFALLGKNGFALSGADFHNHADDASFIMMVNGQMMAMDPGYVYQMNIDSAITLPEFAINRLLFRDSVAKPEDHNLILVDNKGTDYGIPSKSNGANCYIEKYFKSPVQNYAEVRTNYQSTDITRKVLHVRNKYFLLIDHMVSDAPHQYSMLLHGYGATGIDSFTNGRFFNFGASNRAAWKRNKSGLYAYTNSDQTMTMIQAKGRHEHTYFFMQPHIYTTSVNIFPAKEMSFMTCLQTFKNMATDTFPVATLNIPNALCYKITDAGNLDIAISKSLNNTITVSKTTTGLSNDYVTDAKFFWASENAGTVKDLFLYKSTHLVRDNDTLFSTDKPYNIEYLSGTNKITGFSGDTGMIHFHTTAYPYQVVGEGVWGTKFDATRNVIDVYFGKSSSFIVNMDNTRIGLNKTESLNTFTLFPNPAGDEVFLSFSDFIDQSSVIDIFDLSGKLVWSEPVRMNTRAFRLNTSQMESGIYFISIRDSEGIRTRAQKLMINR